MKFSVWTQIKSQAKAVPLHATEAAEGEEVYRLLILDLGTRRGWVVSVTPRRALAPGKGPPVPTVQEAGWAPEPVWTQRLKEKSFHLCQGSNPDRPVVQSVIRHYTDRRTPAPKLEDADT
jgi:hypothetical protein